MKVDDIFHGENLKASDLCGKEVTLTVAGWALVEFDDGKKLQLRFQETERSFICNKTNSTEIASFLGGDTDGWPGGRITLFPTRVDFGGKMVDAIRVKQTPQKAGVITPKPIEEPDADEIPF